MPVHRTGHMRKWLAGMLPVFVLYPPSRGITVFFGLTSSDDDPSEDSEVEGEGCFVGISLISPVFGSITTTAPLLALFLWREVI